MGQSVFDALPKRAQAELLERAAAVRHVQPEAVWEGRFRVSDLPAAARLSDLTLVREVAGWAGKGVRCLYYFVSHSPSLDASSVIQCFEVAKSRDGARAYPRQNKTADDPSQGGKSLCIYVGSSESMADRLGQHLGYGPARTYALQLIHWASELPSMQIDFVCARYAAGTSLDVIQALEDALWKQLQPMFGRLGAR